MFSLALSLSLLAPLFASHSPLALFALFLADGFVNTGYAFNRSVFDLLYAHQDLFWSFSEGWDYSFFHLIQVRELLHKSVKFKFQI